MQAESTKTHSIVTSGLDIFCIGGGGVDYPSLEMSLPVVDIGSAEMSDRGIVCVCSAPALRAPPLAASEAPNSTESLDEVFEKGAKQLHDVCWVLGWSSWIGHHRRFGVFERSDDGLQFRVWGAIVICPRNGNACSMESVRCKDVKR